jgi:hypothetical protein
MCPFYRRHFFGGDATSDLRDAVVWATRRRQQKLSVNGIGIKRFIAPIVFPVAARTAWRCVAGNDSNRTSLGALYSTLALNIPA